jgi:hypothetical protein
MAIADDPKQWGRLPDQPPPKKDNLTTVRILFDGTQEKEAAEEYMAVISGYLKQFMPSFKGISYD